MWHKIHAMAQIIGKAAVSRGLGVLGRMPFVRCYDTLTMVRELEDCGYTVAQSEQINATLLQSLNENTKNTRSNLVMRDTFEKIGYDQTLVIAALRDELESTESSSFAATKNDHETIDSDIEKVKTKFREELLRIQARLRLDLNLEKSRVRDRRAEHDLRLRETDAKIDEVISGLETHRASVKLSIIQWVTGLAAAAAGLLFTLFRFLL